eukprot:scaffold24623_cov66-Phaeocystis_antarctica.AAC.5
MRSPRPPTLCIHTCAPHTSAARVRGPGRRVPREYPAHTHPCRTRAAPPGSAQGAARTDADDIGDIVREELLKTPGLQHRSRSKRSRRPLAGHRV